MAVAPQRIQSVNEAPVRADGKYILYWMTAARRLGSNYALQRAVDWCEELGQPLVILEALRCDYPHASDRLHAFAIDGMRGHAARLAGTLVRYYPFVEAAPGADRGLLAALSADACLVVTDWYPAFIAPRLLASAARQVQARLEAVDSNGVLPVLDAGRAFTTAHSFRAHLQRTFRPRLAEWPERDPLARLPRRRTARIRKNTTRRWPPTALSSLDLATLPIDHRVRPVAMTGGDEPARARLRHFIRHGLPRYADDHRQPEQDATSRLSPWLHFGHLSVHDVFDAIMKHERWTARRLGSSSRGAREGWWNASPSAEAFLDELITWRELAFNTCAYVPDFAAFASLPEWARRTLDAHRRDRRPHVYGLEQLDAAATHDPLWNAAQRQLTRDGWFHGYLRMLWGKKILEWSRTPEAALQAMEHLMNRYSLDGRDPNSWAGFTWVLGRYDRPWPEREIFGTVRYMSSENTARKLRIRRYVERYASQSRVASR